MSYDVACEDLARQFLLDYAQSTGADREALAECIQEAIEGWLSQKWPDGAVRSQPSTRHLELVVVLTVLDKVQGPIELDALARRAHGTREQVLSFVRELEGLGKVLVEGELVMLAKKRGGV